MRLSNSLLVPSIVFLLCALTPFELRAQQIISDDSTRPVFKEIWAYLMRGEEKELTGTEPITDLCYFGVGLSKDGRIVDKATKPAIVFKNGQKPRVDIVVAELSNSALMHFSLDPEYGVRPLLIDDICRLSADFDGVQIDFEAVSADDAEYFFGFLKELKQKLPDGKMLSVALPARFEQVADAYDYARVGSIVDRIVIMAYDEHWSTSSPGPVASLAWCAKVAAYARGAVAGDKLVMGLPLYGRAWQDKRLARALRFRNILDIAAENKAMPNYASELGAWFEYSENVVVKVFYDDMRTIMEKLQLYRSKNIASVSFWRIGQGPSELWSSIGLDSGNAFAITDETAVSTPGSAPGSSSAD
ncbi:MAG: glycosyl hydrolase family 18 protein [Spirochaetia bacterium]|jgi:spore germination protein YaaH